MAKVTLKGYLNDPKEHVAKTGTAGWVASFAESESIIGKELEEARAAGVKIREKNGKFYVNTYYNLRCFGDTPMPTADNWFGEVDGTLSVRIYTDKATGAPRISRDVFVSDARPSGGSPNSPAKRRATAPQRKAPDPTESYEVPDDEFLF